LCNITSIPTTTLRFTDLSASRVLNTLPFLGSQILLLSMYNITSIPTTTLRFEDSSASRALKTLPFLASQNSALLEVSKTCESSFEPCAQEDGEDDSCYICQRCEEGDVLLICETCERAAHKKCAKLRSIPKVIILPIQCACLPLPSPRGLASFKS
jgi:hypothetical protein